MNVWGQGVLYLKAVLYVFGEKQTSCYDRILTRCAETSSFVVIYFIGSLDCNLRETVYPGRDLLILN